VCGGTMELWVGQYEESEEITVAETTFRILAHRRQKYRCRCNGSVVTAPGPDKLTPGGRYSIDFAVHSVIAKFCDHNPLERQTRQMERQGLTITSQTLWDQHDLLASHLEATWRRICSSAIEEPVLNVDETGWRMMGTEPDSKWSLFGLTSPKLAAYHLVGSKSAATARTILSGFRGTLVVDGFVIYPIVAALEKSNIKIAHCWAHVDRKFKDAKDPPDRIAEIRGLIHRLYEIEWEVAGPFPGTELAQAERQRLRQEKSQPVLKDIQKWCYAQGGLRRSAFGKAVRYLLKHWNGLEVFVTDPRVALDNNAAERVLRGPVVGRKNFYGNRSKRGAKVAAIFYSLIETAKLNGINPAEYLRRAAIAAIRSPGAATLPC
jgi:transposase